MRKAVQIMISAAIVLLAAACVDNLQNENGQPDESGALITETITARVNEGDTKATINNDYGFFTWVSSDRVAVHTTTDGYVVPTADPDISTTGSGTETISTATFTISYSESGGRDAFAIYPSSIVDNEAAAAKYGQTGSPLLVTLPASYTLAEVSGETSPCPMIASNTGTSWEFKQLCGLLRLTVNCIPPSTKRLEIDFCGKKVCGNFSIVSPNPGTSVITTTDDDSHDVITITKDNTDVTLNGDDWLDGLVLNIPLPIGTYSNITVTAYDTYDTGGNATLTMTREFSYAATRGCGKKKTASFPVFSVSDDTRVIFAPGNLQATYNASAEGEKWTWGFAYNQYDVVSLTGANNHITGPKSADVNGIVDLFGWSTSVNYGINNSTEAADYSGSFIDWGKIKTFSYRGSSNTYSEDYWVTPSQNEWRYVVGKGFDNPNFATPPYRKKGGTIEGIDNALCTKARVNATNETDGVKGFLLFPDYYDGDTPSGVTWDANTMSHGAYEHSGGKGWGAKVTAAGWVALENAGCIFLPVAGIRYGGTYVMNEENGNFSQSTPLGVYTTREQETDSNCRVFRFSSDGFDPVQNISKAYGLPVRLIHVIN